MKTALLLKMMGGCLLLTASTVFVVTTLVPESVGSNFYTPIKDENAMNVYSYINKPLSPVDSYTNFMCKLIVEPKDKNKIEPIYCEIYTWENNNKVPNNKNKLEGFNKLFTKNYDISDSENSLVRVKFDQKHFSDKQIDLNKLKIEISPYNASRVVFKALPLFSLDNKNKIVKSNFWQMFRLLFWKS